MKTVDEINAENSQKAWELALEERRLGVEKARVELETAKQLGELQKRLLLELINVHKLPDIKPPGSPLS